MRASILILAGGLLLAACSDKPAATEQPGTEENLNVATAQGNDVTAIDAATGDDANMAADVEFDLNESEAIGNEAGDEAPGNEG